jgi:hypothetical protein
MKKNKRGDEKNESSVQVALGELMGIEEERQIAEREDARRLAAEQARKRAEEERRRAAEEEARRIAAEAQRRADEQAKEEEARQRQHEAAEREARIRAEAEAHVRSDEVRRMYEYELQMKRIEVGRRRFPPWLAPSIAVLALGGGGLFAALYFSVQAGATERLAEAERSKTSLKTELEREIDAARAERLTAIAELEIAKRRVEDAQRQLKEKCDTVALMNRPPQKPRPGGAIRPITGQSQSGEDLKGVTEMAPYEPDESADTIQLGKDPKKKGKGKKGP